MQSTYSYSKIWKIAYPIFLTLLVQNLIQVIDTAFLGRVGEIELGASALAGIYYIVLFMLAFGFSTGTQILIGRRNGEKNYDKIGEILIHGVIFLLGMALCMFSITKLFSENILSRLFESDNILQTTMEFLDWRIYGLFFSSINVMFRAFFVGITRTKTLTLNAIIMALVNIFFDYSLIFGNLGFPKMGIAGAALASVIAECTSVVFFTIYTLTTVDMKKYGFHLVRFNNFRVLRRILNISLSLMLQNFLSLSTWFFFFLAIEHLGEKPLAITNIVRSVYMIIAIPVFSLAATANTLVSNSIGAGKTQTVMSLIWKVIRMALVICAGFMLIILIFPKEVLSIYTNNRELIEDAVPSLMVVLLALPCMSLGNIFFSSVSGTGNTRTALLIEISTLFIYVFYVWLVVLHLKSDLTVCWISESIYGSFIFIFSFLYIRYGKWQNKQI